MRDLPVVLDGYRLTVVEPPAPKTRTDDKTGREVPATDFEGAQLFVVSVFAKQRPVPGQRAPKGEEIRVTLATDPGMGFPEDAVVELLGPVINHYAMESGGRVNAGLSFKADGMKLAGGSPAGRKVTGKADTPSDENAA